MEAGSTTHVLPDEGQCRWLFPNVRVIISECQGNLTREISELAVWLDTVYESDNAGFREVWAGVVGAMENASTGSTTLETMDAYKIALPVSLASATLDASITFCSINSRPITFNGLSKDNCSELLSSMLHWLFTFFRACASPENFLVRATTAPPQNIPSENGEQKVMLAGGSNMKQCVSPFAATGISVVDICSPGWTPTVGNVTMLAEKIKPQP
jgi:hypothetical protein